MKNTNLQFDLTNTSTTNPVDSALIYAEALIKGGSKETFTPLLNIKDKARIRKHNFGDILQSDSCTFTPDGAGTLSEKLVEACSMKINIEICQSTLEESYVSHTMAAGQLNPDFLTAGGFQAYLMNQLSKETSARLEYITWQGDVTASPADPCDGLLVAFTADATVNDINTGVATTAANVIAQLNAVYAAIPEEVKFSENLVIYVSSNVLSAYRQAVSAASAEGYYDAKLAESNFLGIPMFLSQGLGASDMVAAESTNLFLVSDLLSDFEEIRVIPQMDKTGDDTVRIVGRFKFAVSYAYGSEIVWSRV